MKTYKYYVRLLLLGFLPACSSNKEEPKVTTTLFIQSISSSPTIASITRKVAQAADIIIKQELGINQDADMSFFAPKELQRISLYHVYDIIDSKQSLFLDALDTLRLADKKPINCFIKPKVEFFGEHNDELVVMIDDNNGELVYLNQAIKMAANQVNADYKSAHNQELYNILHSEQFPFLPHMGLGRVSIRKIKQQLKDQEQAEQVVNIIRESIKAVALAIVKSALATENKACVSDKITVLDFNKRTYIKEWK